MRKTFNLFVYGYLRRGFQSSRLIPEEAERLDAAITGNMYYTGRRPEAVVFKQHNYQESSLDYEADLAKQEDANRVEPIVLPFDLEYGKIHGELFRIPFSENVIQQIDEYIGFNDDKYDRKHRTLVPVRITENKYHWAWVYNVDLEDIKHRVRIYSGDWLDCFYSCGGGLRPELSKALSEEYDKDMLAIFFRDDISR